MSLKQKAVSGLTWSFTGNIIENVISFVVGIILARLLTPREYGLVGMVTILIVFTQPFINSGFRQALIRKQDCTRKDFSTVFYFNLIVGLFFYSVLYFTAPNISTFFDEPQLVKIIRVIGLIIIIEAASLIQLTILTKEVDFKILTKINIISSIISGIVGVWLAYRGYGVWSLVYKRMLVAFIKSSLLWLKSRWKPHLVFSISTIKELFGFSSKLLAMDIIDKLYYNIYNLIIAKYFLAKELGLYTRAKMFKDLGSENIVEIISRVAYPVLSKIQDSPDKLSNHYINILKGTMFIVLSAMFGLSAISEALVLTLIGDKWVGSIVYLQLLSFVGIYYPMHALSRTLFYVYGRSGLFFRLDLFTKLLAIWAILVGVYFGIKFMIVAMIINGFIEYMVKAYYSGRLIGYNVIKHIKDLGPSFALALFLGSSLYTIQYLLDTQPIITLLIQLLAGSVLFIGISELFKIYEYMFIKGIIKDKISGRKRPQS